ncbi:hypothetical protein G5I_11385 [Acromyrmex echinatior]|uniref:Uncharacterized protein n=1 Tax=Acromyrmex echinatior TaxID=103372 RepID=F4WZG3_ACREC|nr:hypothetical protein G5I_11385 [Acromyrmex echinatior]
MFVDFDYSTPVVENQYGESTRKCRALRCLCCKKSEDIHKNKKLKMHIFSHKDFVQVSKNLAGYRSKNNVIKQQNNYIIKKRFLRKKASVAISLTCCVVRNLCGNSRNLKTSDSSGKGNTPASLKPGYPEPARGREKLRRFTRAWTNVDDRSITSLEEKEKAEEENNKSAE